jgi:hypothetical protein
VGKGAERAVPTRAFDELSSYQMSRYRRVEIEGGIFFFTVALADRSSKLLVREIDLLRRSYKMMQERLLTERSQSASCPTIFMLSGNYPKVMPISRRVGRSSNRLFRVNCRSLCE